MSTIENQTTTTQDVNTPAASSATSDVNNAASSSASDAQTPSASSTDNGGKQKEALSWTDRVTNAIENITKRKTSEASPTTETKEQKQEQPAQAGEINKDGTETTEVDDEKSAGEFKDHPVFKKIIAERKAARAERDKALKEVEVYKKDAEGYRTVDTFLKTNNVSYEDAGEALKLAALARTNPTEFYKRLTGLAGQWGQHLGEVLPPDLQKQVDEGMVAEDVARELARTRGQVATTQAQLAQREQQVQEADTRTELKMREQLVESWITQVRNTDPEIEKKLNLISSRLTEILVKEGNPRDANEMWARMNRAYTDINNHLKGFQPAKPMTPAAPQSTGTPRGGVPAPQNYNDAWETAFSKITAR